MKNAAQNKQIAKVFFIPIALFISGILLLQFKPELVSEIVNKQPIIWTLLVVFLGIFWNAITRLNSLDDIDGLKDNHRQLIRYKSNDLKSMLHKRISVLIFSGIVFFISSVVRSAYPETNIALTLWLPLLFSVLWFYGATYPMMFDAIEQLRSKVSDMKRKEKARQELIEELRKDRSSQPFENDAHLDRYKHVERVDYIKPITNNTGI